MPNYEPFWEAWRAGSWEPGTRDWLRSVLKPGDLFVDVGAWIGPVSVWALEVGAYVVAIEPDPVAYTELRAQLSRFDERSWESWPAALVADDADTSVILAANPNPGGALGDSMSRVAPELDGIAVAGFTLERILNGRIPVAAKIDVEGYETHLAPVVVPWLVERDCAVQVSIHGQRPAVDVPSTVGVEFVPDPRWGDLRYTP